MQKEIQHMRQRNIIDHIIEIIEDIISGDSSSRTNISKASDFHRLGRAVNALAENYQMAQETITMLNQQLKKNNLDVIMALIEALNAKDPYTRGHCERVPVYASLIARRLSLTEDELDAVYLASYLHDIGKIGIHDDILNKRGSLTRDEYEKVKAHSLISSQIVSQIPNLSHIASVVRHHHEHHNGAGYPDGLSGDEIPLGSRILAIADAFDAMTSARPYRLPIKPQEALQEIKRCAGHQFDPNLAHLFADAYIKAYGNRIPNLKAS